MNRTCDFFRLLPLSAVQKACGILLGGNLLTLLFAAVSLVPVLLFGLLGQVPPFLEGQIILLLVSVALFTNSVVLLSPETTPRKRAQTSTTMRILLLVFAGPFLRSPAFALIHAASEVHKAQGFCIAFYNVNVPALLAIGLVVLYFGIWNVLGIVRRFTSESEPLFSRKTGLLFLVGYELIALGFFLSHLPDPRGILYPMWLLASLVPVVLIPFGSLRTFDGYLERCDPLRVHREAPVRATASTLLTHSNLSLTAGLFLVWLVFSALAGAANKMSMTQVAFDSTAILSFCLVLFFLLERYVVYEPIYGKIGLLLGFCALLYLILPLILSAAFGVGWLRFYSLFGLFTNIASPSEDLSTTVEASILLVNALLCTIPARLIWKRYTSIPLLKQGLTGTIPVDHAHRSL